MVHARRDSDGALYCGGTANGAHAAIDRAVFRGAVVSSQHPEEYCPECRQILDWETAPGGRPPCFQSRALVLAENRQAFRWYCEGQLPTAQRAKAVLVSEANSLQFLRGLDPLGWSIHIAGEPSVGWLLSILRGLDECGFAKTRLARG